MTRRRGIALLVALILIVGAAGPVVRAATGWPGLILWSALSAALGALVGRQIARAKR